jgi:hypothetical protein
MHNKTNAPDWESLAGLSLKSVNFREALPPAGDPHYLKKVRTYNGTLRNKATHIKP